MLRKAASVSLALVLLAALAPSVVAETSKPVDLGVIQTDNPDPVLEHGFVTYSVVVTNHGPQPANKFGVTLSLDVGQYISASGHRWTCSASGTSGSCTHQGARPLSEGASTATLKVVAQAPAATEAGVIHNTATVVVSDGYDDQNSVNNTSEEDTTITEGADLTLSQTDEPDPVGSGDLMRYLLTANNNSDTVTAEGVGISSELSGGTFDSFGGTGWACTLSSTTADCSHGDLDPNGTTEALELYVVANESESDFIMSNTATVSATTADNDTSNNSDTEGTDVWGTGTGKASALIPPEGGSVSTCADAGPNSADHTCATTTFPPGPGGIATLIEGPQIALCATVGCVGDSVDVIVPDGYDLLVTAPIQLFLKIDASVAGSEANDSSRSVFVRKADPDSETDFETVAIPSCTVPIVGLPCLRRIERIEGNDLQAVVEMFSGDPIFDVGDGLG